MFRKLEKFGGHDLKELLPDEILTFLNLITNGRKPQTKRVRFAHLTAFFNFIKNNINPAINNPCHLPMLRKLFRQKIAGVTLERFVKRINQFDEYTAFVLGTDDVELPHDENLGRGSRPSN